MKATANPPLIVIHQAVPLSKINQVIAKAINARTITGRRESTRSQRGTLVFFQNSGHASIKKNEMASVIASNQSNLCNSLLESCLQFKILNSTIQINASNCQHHARPLATLLIWHPQICASFKQPVNLHQVNQTDQHQQAKHANNQPPA